MRHLNEREKRLITCLLNQVADTELKNRLRTNLENAVVEDMNDGGMGSIHFVCGRDRERKMGRCVVEKVFQDVDNVPIMVYLDLDEQDDLFELDIWKGDFSPVISYPECK